jgi:hypothetical protein
MDNVVVGNPAVGASPSAVQFLKVYPAGEVGVLGAVIFTNAPLPRPETLFPASLLTVSDWVVSPVVQELVAKLRGEVECDIRWIARWAARDNQ